MKLLSEFSLWRPLEYLLLNNPNMLEILNLSSHIGTLIRWFRFCSRVAEELAFVGLAFTCFCTTMITCPPIQIRAMKIKYSFGSPKGGFIMRGRGSYNSLRIASVSVSTWKVLPKNMKKIKKIKVLAGLRFEFRLQSTHTFNHLNSWLKECNKWTWSRTCVYYVDILNFLLNIFIY